jgi:signal transduction histidine kinase
VLWTSYLALWAAGDSLREQRQQTALALATAAASAGMAVLASEKPLDARENRQRLDDVARDLTSRDDAVQVSFLAPDRAVVASRPPRDRGDVDPPLLTAALSGDAPRLNYRDVPGGERQLLAFAAMKTGSRVLGAVRVMVPAESPVVVVIRRSGWVLLMLAVADALLVIALGYLVLTRFVVRPLQTVERATARVSAGEWDQVITPSGPREVMALGAAFNQMTASLAAQREQLIRTEKLASVGQLAAGVAHEIGNPLAAILGFVDLLRGEGPHALPPEDRRDLLERVRAETQRIHRIIQDLLDYSRPTRDDAQPTDPLKILRASQGLLEPQKRFRGVRVVASPDDPQARWPQVLV